MYFRRVLSKLVSMVLILSPILATGFQPPERMEGALSRLPEFDKVDLLSGEYDDLYQGINEVLHPNAGLAASFSDYDGDGLDDAEELLLAHWYVPYLIFDEDEQQSIIDKMATLFQATPVWGSNSSKNERYIKQVILTFVFLYEYDKGADIHGCYGSADFLWGLLDLFALFPKVSKQNILAIKSGHCGDSEAIKVYVNYSTEKNTWSVGSVKINRHHGWEGPYSNLNFNGISSGKSGCQASRGTCYHPRIYVSQNKHAMYTAMEGKDVGCETVGSKKVSVKGIGCTISWEDCDSDDPKDKIIPTLSASQNVGENGRSYHRYSTVSSTKAKNSNYYPGEWIWPDSSDTRDDIFCGGFKTTSKTCAATGCAGAISGKWELFKHTNYAKIKNYRFVD